MFTILFAVFMGLIAYVAGSNGETGVVVLAVALALVWIISGLESLKSARAWQNHRNYWAKGGPDRRLY